MSWDPDGFCSRCQRQLGADCRCRGAAEEHQRRRQVVSIDPSPVPLRLAAQRRGAGETARAAAAGHGRGELPPQGPHPAERYQERGEPVAEPVVLPGIPAYPAAALAGPLADLVSSTTLPSALVAGAGLGALAGICGTADLVMPDGSLVRPALWVPLVAPRGAGKTPSMDKAFGTVRELDAAAHEQYRMEVAARTPGAASPQDPTRRIDDATLEVVARFLAAGDGTGVVEADELSGWLQSIGQYKRVSGDKGRWLAMWSAQPWRYQRVGIDRAGGVGTDLYIGRPVVSIVGGIQPHLHNLLGDADSGFRPRWLPHMAPLETITWGSRVHRPAEWESAAEKLYWMRQRREWELSGETLGLWQQQCAKWKRQARGSENASASAALDKSDIQSARIALVIAESMQPGAGGRIPADAMRCALAITDYVMDCWRALPGHESFALSRRDEILNSKVDELAGWLETRAGRKATRTQIKEAHIGGVRTAGDIDILLAAYLQVYPGTLRRHQPEGGGRPADMVYAPPRGPRDVSPSLSQHTPGVSDRSETPGVGVGSITEVKPQVAMLRGVSDQVVGNSVVGNSVVGNSGTQYHDVPSCEICRNPLDPRLVGAGQTIHPACESAPENSTDAGKVPA